MRRAPKMIRFPPSLTDQLAALIGEEDAGGDQNCATDHERLARQVGDVARGGHRRLLRGDLGRRGHMLGLIRHLRCKLNLRTGTALGSFLAGNLGVELSDSSVELALAAL